MHVILNMLKGVAIGLANVIPGVSGGTMALMLGIYERLIRAIHNIGGATLLAPFRGRAALREQLRRTDALFLLSIGTGAALAAIGAAKLLLYLLEHHHDPTYGFFFGLVVLSLAVPLRMIKRRSVGVVVAAVVAVVAVVGLTLAMSGEQRLETAQRKAQLKASSAHLVGSSAAEYAPAVQVDVAATGFFVVAGAVAISAMILPGISGSFMLLLMGIYFDVLTYITRAVSLSKELVKLLFGASDSRQGVTLAGLLVDLGAQLIPLAALGVGCVVGLLLFTRMVNYMLERYHDLTMGFLLGLVLGSLYAIWPFKSYQEVAGMRIDLQNVWPGAFGANEMLTLATTVAGAAVVAAFLLIERRQQRAAEAVG